MWIRRTRSHCLRLLPWHQQLLKHLLGSSNIFKYPPAPLNIPKYPLEYLFSSTFPLLLHFCEESASYLCLNFVYFITVAKYYFSLPLVTLPKRMNFQKSSKRLLLPTPLIFGKSYSFFRKSELKKLCIKVQNLQHKFLHWKWPHLPSPPLYNFCENQAFW